MSDQEEEPFYLFGRPCWKCGSEEVTRRYCEVSHKPNEFLMMYWGPEHLECTCDHCGFAWRELCADAS